MPTKTRTSRKGIWLNTGRTHFPKGHVPWNKGLTKENNETVLRISQQVRQKLTKRPMPKPKGFSDTMKRARPAWERKYDSSGYVILNKPDYPGAHTRKYMDGRIFEHRYIMEQHLGRLLCHEEQIHHIDGDKRNNARENLLLLANVREHSALHQKEQRFVEQLIREGKVYYDRQTEIFVLR